MPISIPFSFPKNITPYIWPKSSMSTGKIKLDNQSVIVYIKQTPKRAFSYSIQNKKFKVENVEDSQNCEIFVLGVIYTRDDNWHYYNLNIPPPSDFNIKQIDEEFQSLLNEVIHDFTSDDVKIYSGDLEPRKFTPSPIHDSSHSLYRETLDGNIGKNDENKPNISHVDLNKVKSTLRKTSNSGILTDVKNENLINNKKNTTSFKHFNKNNKTSKNDTLDTKPQPPWQSRVQDKPVNTYNVEDTLPSQEDVNDDDIKPFSQSKDTLMNNYHTDEKVYHYDNNIEVTQNDQFLENTRDYSPKNNGKQDTENNGKQDTENHGKQDTETHGKQDTENLIQKRNQSPNSDIKIAISKRESQLRCEFQSICEKLRGKFDLHLSNKTEEIISLKEELLKKEKELNLSRRLESEELKSRENELMKSLNQVKKDASAYKIGFVFFRRMYQRELKLRKVLEEVSMEESGEIGEMDNGDIEGLIEARLKVLDKLSSKKTGDKDLTDAIEFELKRLNELLSSNRPNTNTLLGISHQSYLKAHRREMDRYRKYNEELNRENAQLKKLVGDLGRRCHSGGSDNITNDIPLDSIEVRDHNNTQKSPNNSGKIIRNLNKLRVIDNINYVPSQCPSDYMIDKQVSQLFTPVNSEPMSVHRELSLGNHSEFREDETLQCKLNEQDELLQKLLIKVKKSNVNFDIKNTQFGYPPPSTLDDHNELIDSLFPSPDELLVNV